MIKGIPFDFGDRTLVVPPLSLGTMEAMRERIEKMQNGDDSNGVSTVIDLAHAALRRNYPDMTRDDVAELVDVGNMARLVDATMGVGSKRTEPAVAPDAPKTITTTEEANHG